MSVREIFHRHIFHPRTSIELHILLSLPSTARGIGKAAGHCSCPVAPKTRASVYFMKININKNLVINRLERGEMKFTKNSLSSGEGAVGGDTICRHNHSHLALMSTEYNILRNTDCSKTVQDFAKSLVSQ